MCSPVYVLAYPPFSTVCRNSGLPGMHISILLLASDTCRIPGTLAAWGGGVCWWYDCPPGPYLSFVGIFDTTRVQD